MRNSTERFYILCGPIGAVLLFAGFVVAKVIPPTSPEATAKELAAFFADDANRIRVGLNISFFGTALLGPWFAMITTTFKRMEGQNSAAAYVQLGLGCLLILEILFPLMILMVAAFRPDRPADQILLLSDLCWIPVIGLIHTFVVQVVVAAVAILKDRSAHPIFPRWMGWFTLWVGLVSAPGCLAVFGPTGPFAWGGLFGYWLPAVAFGWWFILTTYFMLKVEDRPAALAAAPVEHYV